MRERGRTFKNLVFVGEFMHSVGRYHVVKARPDAVPRIGAPVYDRYGRKLGIVTDVFGPVSSPYFAMRGNKAQQVYVSEGDLLGKVSR